MMNYKFQIKDDKADEVIINGALVVEHKTEVVDVAMDVARQLRMKDERLTIRDYDDGLIVIGIE